MQELILSYLSKHKQLSVKGIGIFYKKIVEPQWNGAEQAFSQPEVEVTFEPKSNYTTASFLDYAAIKQNVSVLEIENQITALSNQPIIEIDGLGKLDQSINGFNFEAKKVNLLQRVTATPTLYHKTHEMVVGDKVVDLDTMKDYYDDHYEAPKKRWYWLHTAWLVFVITAAYLVYYFYSTSN